MVFKKYPELRFCKIKKGTKKPFEKDWVNKPYTWEEITPHISNEKNYGVMCGYGGLTVIDCDTKELEDAVTLTLPTTLKVRTGGGGLHIYYICRGLKKKIVLQTDKHWGEVQSFGTQVIGFGSLHPNGNEYKIVDENASIAEISTEQLTLAIKPFMKEIVQEENKSIKMLRSYGDSDISSISITNVISTSGFKRAANGEYYGSNPWHGSETGMNFWVNPSKNLAHCFRCDCGLNVAQAIGLNEGIIKNCYDKLGKDDFKKVLEVAQSKYGLKIVNKLEIKKVILAEKDADAKKEEFLLDSFNMFTDYLAIAKSFIEKHPLYYDDGKSWWLWNPEKKCYVMKDEIDLLNSLDTKVKLPSVDSKVKNECLEALKRMGRKNVPKPVKKTWIQFDDTIVDIITGEQFQATPEYFVCNPIPWKLHKEKFVETPMMDKIFEEWVGKGDVKLLYEILAYCLLPDYPIHRLFVLIGAGLNGKSKYIELIKKFLGIQNVTTTELDTLLDSRFEVTRLHKKLLCVMGETNFHELKRTSLLKKLTGGDLIGYEYKGKTPFEDYNYAKIVIATNTLPTTVDKTLGFYRRWQIVDFPNRFSEKKDILADIPDEEFESLAVKCSMILKDLLECRSFTGEGEIEDRMKRFEEKSNPLGKFIKENVITSVDDSLFKWEFREKFKSWLREHGHRNWSDSEIGLKMKDLYEEKQDGATGYRKWLGIRWRSERDVQRLII